MVRAMPGSSPSPRRGGPPRRLDHTLRRNKYPDNVFNHDRSYSLEAGRLFIRHDRFPCDPEGVTCNTLHLFHQFFCNVHQRYRNGHKRALFTRPFFKEDAGTGVEESPGCYPFDELLQRCGR